MAAFLDPQGQVELAVREISPSIEYHILGEVGEGIRRARAT